MFGLDLGALKAAIVVEGADKAKADLTGVNNAIKDTEKTIEENKTKLDSLGDAFRNGADDAKIFGSSLNGAFLDANQSLKQFDTSIDNLASTTSSSLDKVGESVNNAFKEPVGNAEAGMKSLSDTILESLGGVDIFGVKLGDVGKAMGDSSAMAGVLGGAVGALTVAFVQLAIQGIQMAIQAIKEFIVNGVELASELKEVQNVVDVTFGEGSKEIDKFARDSAKAFGLTELQAKKYSSTLGAMFKSMQLGEEATKTMSRNMTQLAGDMASFYNLDIDTAFEKLRSGISGETEPLKQLGINLNVANLEAYALAEGITTAYNEMSMAEQATLRYNYILQATADAQGDFARTQDSYANASRNLENSLDSAGAKLGQGFLPVLTDAKETASGLMDKFSPLIELIGSVLGGTLSDVGKVIEFTVLKPLEGLLDLVNLLIVPLNKVRDAFGYFGEIVGDTFEGIVDDVKKELGIVDEEADVTYDKLKLGMEETAESIEGANQKVYDSFDELYNDIQNLTDEHYDSLKKKADEYKSEYQMYEDVYTDYVRDQVKEREKEIDRLNEKNADKGSLDFLIWKAEELKRAEDAANKEVAKLREENEAKYIKLLDNTKVQAESIAKNEVSEKANIYQEDVKNFSDAEKEKTKISKEEAEKRKNDLSTIISGLDGFIRSSMNLPAHATGTLYSRGGLALVGEHGAELVRLGSGDRVYTHNETTNILGQNNNGTLESILTAILGKLESLERIQEDAAFKQLVYGKM